jgi:hypothetical protein
VNNKNTRSRMEVSSVGKCMRAKEDESSTGCIWAAVFHHVTTRSLVSHVTKFMNRLFL